jgi:HPt (histidine-containing phosphotransfer) domain-containing protein
MTAGKPYDLTTIYAISDDNQEFLEQLLIVFTNTVSQDVAAMRVAADNNNWAEVGKIAHKIKPSVSHFGINSLTDVIRGLEHNNGADEIQLSALVNQLETVMNSVVVGLKEEFPNVFK